MPELVYHILHVTLSTTLVCLQQDAITIILATINSTIIVPRVSITPVTTRFITVESLWAFNSIEVVLTALIYVDMLLLK